MSLEYEINTQNGDVDILCKINDIYFEIALKAD